jgi:hypothetical protein
MVAASKSKQVIKYKTQASYGFAPLPETTYELSSDGTEDKVRIVSIAGQSKTLKIIKVPTGTYEHWLEILIATHDKQSLGKTFGSFMDGSLDDLWFVMNGKKVHLHWMVEPPEDQKAISDFIKWLHQLTAGSED